MPNLTPILNEHIRRLARREIKASTSGTKRAGAKYRRDIAALKRLVVVLGKRLSQMEKKGVGAGTGVAVAEVAPGARFRADGLKTHRAKLGLSARDYGKLVGVSELTIYHWENGKFRPRRSQMGSLVAVRGMGKREAYEKLGKEKPAGPGRPVGSGGGISPKGAGRRRVFGQTAEELIFSLLKKNKRMATAAINEAWRKEGRAGTADMTLMRLVKGKRLKRMANEGGRGSLYGVG